MIKVMRTLTKWNKSELFELFLLPWICLGWLKRLQELGYFLTLNWAADVVSEQIFTVKDVFLQRNSCSSSWERAIRLQDMLFQPFHSQDLTSDSPSCPQNTSFDLSLRNFLLDQGIPIEFFSILISSAC